jgi:hypothetical protein
MTTSRPAIGAGSAVLLLVLSLFNLSTPVQPASTQPPLPVIIYAVGAGVVGLVAVAGVWSRKRWGWLMTVILSAVSALVAAPGVFLAPTLVGKSVSVGLIVGYGMVLALTALRATRAALA